MSACRKTKPRAERRQCRKENLRYVWALAKGLTLWNLTVLQGYKGMKVSYHQKMSLWNLTVFYEAARFNPININYSHRLNI